MKKRDTSKKRSDILEAARDQFLALGFDHASMDGIAEKANASKRTIYNHFPSKETLFQSVVEHFIDALDDQKALIFCSETPVSEQLANYLDMKIELSRSPSFLDFVRLTFGVMMTHPSLAQHIRASLNAHESQLIAWLEKAQASGQIHVQDPTGSAKTLEKWASGAFLWPAILGIDNAPDALLAQKAQILEWFLWHTSK